MARPDGRAFCALWAQSRRAAAHSGGPRPSRPASALAPGLGLVAASVWARPCGRASRPGPRPALPTRRPRGLVLLTARREDASPAGWWGLPSAPSGRVPPAPSGLRAATPAHPGRLGRRPPRPHSWGLLGRCGPPARACLAPACRLAAALPALGPPGVAAPPRCGVPPPSRGAASAPSGRVPCAAAI